MFAKLLTLFALVAVALAAPKPAPAPQVYAYPAAGVDYVYPGSVVPGGAIVSPYAVTPLARPTLPGGAVFYR